MANKGICDHCGEDDVSVEEFEDSMLCFDCLQHAAYTEDEEDYSICGNCNGSGEGQYEGTTCWQCGGTGVETSDCGEANF